MKGALLLCLVLVVWQDAWSQTRDSTATSSKFETFNKKAEALFKYLPVPLYSHSTEAGDIFGLAKFNLFQLSKKDKVSRPSKLSEVFTISTKGRVNFSVANDLIFGEDKYMVLSYVNYKKQPEYFYGIGNDVDFDTREQIQFDRVKFSSAFMRRVWKKYMYAGVALDLSNYYDLEVDSNNYLVDREDVVGISGGTSLGIGFSAAWDNRNNRYNPQQGMLVLATWATYPKGIGAGYGFSSFDLDARKYYNPWHKHIIAVQVTTSWRNGDVPFYYLAMLGGDSKMRGYYQGALRDNVSLDTQVEYRLPVWDIFGVVGWVGAGRVAPSYKELSLDGLYLSYGGGIRIRVDSKNNTNLRFDVGFGQHGMQGFYINFAEAF